MTDKDPAARFWADGFRLAEGLLPAQQCAFLRQCMDAAQRSGRMRTADNAAYRGPNNEYAPAPAELVLRALAPAVSQLVGCEVLPSYSFWRIYEQGAELRPHKDRPACEVSLTVAIAAEPEEEAWPICLTDRGGQDHRIALKPGAALLYRGPEVRHWREVLEGARHYQMFLHYVVAGGPFAALADEGSRAGRA
jgi:alkylated DNA repair dioxygenase AlkB